MQVLKQQLLHSGIAPTLLVGWEQHQKLYDGKPILWPRLLNEAMELIPLETDAWNAIQNLYSKIMGNQQYIRLLWHLHVLIADSE